MEQAIILFGYLVLTFLGFVVPILGILLSIYQEGISKLTLQYKNEKSQNEKNIKEYLAKSNSEEGIDSKSIKGSLDALTILEKAAKYKLSYLNPKKQILRLFSYFFISFLGVILAILKLSLFWSFLLSLISFSYAIVILWKLFEITVEVKRIIDQDKQEENLKVVELLSKLVEREEKSFLKKVYITLNKKNIKDDMAEIELEANKRHELPISINNSETRAAKNVEIGFIFTSDFIIEKTNYYSIYTTQDNQIVRYKESFIHGITNQMENPLIITPLGKGSCKIKTFVKGENIEAVYTDLKFNIK